MAPASATLEEVEAFLERRERQQKRRDIGSRTASSRDAPSSSVREVAATTREVILEGRQTASLPSMTDVESQARREEVTSDGSPTHTTQDRTRHLRAGRPRRRAARPRDPLQGRRRQTPAPQRRGRAPDARDALAEARTRRVQREAEPLDPRATFGAVCDAFEAAHVASLRPNSQPVNHAALKRLRAEFGSKRITQIGRADVRRFVNELAAERKANTVRSYYAVLRAVFNFAASDLDIPIAFPRLKPGELPDPADDQREQRILTDDELARVLDACDPRTRLYFQTLAETGARASEVLGLTPQSDRRRDDHLRAAARPGRAALRR